MICFPNAKINLGLSVTEKRADGMHNIETCYVPIPIFDILEIQPSKSFSLENMGLPLLDSINDNLIVRAWNLLSSVKNIDPVKVCLYKNIPLGSGLGGGSSNAAFFLKAINELCSVGLSITDMELLATEIGADCPFFIRNETVMATGTGNIFSPINNPVSGMFITVVFPQVHISSKDGFSKIDSKKSTKMITVLESGKLNWKNNLKNDFEKIVFREYPEISNIKDLLYNAGAVYASLTGSGSSLYALSEKPLNTEIFLGKNKLWTGIVD